MGLDPRRRSEHLGSGSATQKFAYQFVHTENKTDQKRRKEEKRKGAKNGVKTENS